MKDLSKKKFFLGNYSEEEDPNYDYEPTHKYDYDVYPDYKGPMYQSQACHKNGVSYTPPGWYRRYHYKKTLKNMKLSP